MPAVTNFHNKSFDDGTLLKLEILEDYISEWLPVFLYTPNISDIYIYDLYCGPGCDTCGIPGSPMRIYKVLNAHTDSIKNKKIHVWLNDMDSEKTATCARIEKPQKVQCCFTSKPADKCFEAIPSYKFPNGSAHFFYVDPCGIVDYKMVLKTIDRLGISEALLFIPASFISRFYEQDSFSSRLPNFPPNVNQKNILKEFCKYCKKEFNLERTYFSYFTIKKQTFRQIHGLIFMTRHHLGLEKFLNVTWKKSANGESNFALTGDVPENGQYFLSNDFSMTSKIPFFQNMLREKIISKELLTNTDVYLFTIQSGHIIKHAKSVVTKLFKDKIILNNVPISYDNAFKKEPISIILS